MDDVAAVSAAQARSGQAMVAGPPNIISTINLCVAVMSCSSQSQVAAIIQPRKLAVKSHFGKK
jgi:hypothetical protein